MSEYEDEEMEELSEMEEQERVAEEYASFEFNGCALAKNTQVFHDGVTHEYLVGDVPLPAHALQITNPSCWEAPKSAPATEASEELAFENKRLSERSAGGVDVYEDLEGTVLYEELTVPKLVRLATARGDDLGSSTRKSHIIEALRAADAEAVI